MKTKHVEEAGELRVVLRSDGSIYLGRIDSRYAGVDGEFGFMDKEKLLIGSTPMICSALAEAFTRMGERIRAERASPERFDEEKPPAQWAASRADIIDDIKAGAEEMLRVHHAMAHAEAPMAPPPASRYEPGIEEGE